MLLKNPRLNWIWEKSANLLLVVIFGHFLYDFAIDFAINMRASTLIMMVYEAMLVYFLFTRAMPIGVSTSPYDWFVSIAGTWVPLLMRPGQEIHENGVLQILQLVGLTISLLGLLSLNKSFGIVAANRGVKTNGIYAYVRHPLYCGYVISLGTFVWQNAAQLNIILYMLLIIFQVLRILSEEKFLAKDVAYRCYVTKTRWRLVPFVW